MSPTEFQTPPRTPLKFLADFRLPPINLTPLKERLSASAAAVVPMLSKLRFPPLSWRPFQNYLSSVQVAPALRLTGRFTNAALAVGATTGVFVLAKNVPDVPIVAPLTFLLTIPVAGFIKAAVSGTLNPFKASSEFFSEENTRPAILIAALFAAAASLTSINEMDKRQTANYDRSFNVGYTQPDPYIPPAYEEPEIAPLVALEIQQAPPLPALPQMAEATVPVRAVQDFQDIIVPEVSIVETDTIQIPEIEIPDLGGETGDTEIIEDTTAENTPPVETVNTVALTLPAESFENSENPVTDLPIGMPVSLRLDVY